MAFQYVTADFLNFDSNTTGTSLGDWSIAPWELEIPLLSTAAFTGDLDIITALTGQSLINPVDGTFTIGAIDANVDFVLDFPHVDLGELALMYGTLFSVEVPDDVLPGESFSITLGELVQDGDKHAVGESLEVSAGSASIDFDFSMGSSNIDFDGFLEIWGHPLVEWDKTFATPEISFEDFVLFEVSPDLLPKAGLDDLIKFAANNYDFGGDWAATLFNMSVAKALSISLGLPSAETDSAELDGTGEVNTLAPIQVVIEPESMIAELEVDLVKLLGVGPLAWLQTLSNTYDLPFVDWELKADLLKLPVSIGLGIQQTITFTPDLNSSTVTLVSGEASGDIGVEKAFGSTFDLVASEFAGDTVDLSAELNLGGTISVDYALVVNATAGFTLFDLALQNGDDEAPISMHGPSETFTLFTIPLVDIPGTGQIIDVTAGMLTEALDIQIGAGSTQIVGDGLLHAYTEGEKTFAQMAIDALADDPNIAFVPGSVTVTGSTSSIGWFDAVDADFGALGGGIFLTSGNQMPPYENTDSGFGADRGEPGDARLDAIVASVFEGDYETYDATVFGFDVKITNPAATSITFDVVFGSEEFPEFVDDFVDIGAVFVNGVNYAYFDEDTSRPLSVISENLDAGYFIDNTGGQLSIEYDGLSQVLTISAPVKFGTNRIEIAVADTGDHVLDSAIAVANIRTGEYTGGGTKLLVTPAGSDSGDNVLVSGDDDVDEFFETGDGNDFVSAKKGNDILVLGNGNDEGWGGEGDDQLDGGSGNDKLYGGYGFDWFVAASGAGDDLYDGGEDFDTAAFLSATKQIIVDLLAGTATGVEIGNDTLVSIEKVLAGRGNDILRGSMTADWLEGGIGADVLIGRAGNDTLLGQGGNDKIFGYNGDDVLGGGWGNDVLLGGSGFDIADYSNATKRIVVNLQLTGVQVTGQGSDRLAGIEGVVSGDGFDKLVGNALGNMLSGGGHGDVLIGNNGNDILNGGFGNDKLYGGNGRDTAVFSSGNDITVKLWQSTVQGTGEGRDLLRGIENATSGAGDDLLVGNKLSNTLVAGDGDDILKGGSANDWLFGGANDDQLFGQLGNDVLRGGTGDDVLFGGLGADKFIFGPDFGHDIVADFAPDVAGEVLNLSAVVASLSELTIEAANGGADTLITVTATGDSILLQGVVLDQFNAENDILL